LQKYNLSTDRFVEEIQVMRSFLRPIFITMMVSVLALTACTSEQTPRPTEQPAARLWFVDSSSGLLGSLMPAIAVAPAPAAPAAAELEAWRVPPTRWLALERELVAREWAAPTRAARCYALLAGGMSDVLLVADAARAQGMDVSDDAALAAFAKRVIGYNHPTLAEIAQQKADQARWVGVWSGKATPAGVELGERIGTAVADRVIAWAQRDGAEGFTEFTTPAAAPGVWQPTPPRLWSALDPGWGNVRPIVIPSGESMDAEPPPAWDSDAFKADRADFAQHQQQLTDAERALAKKWAGGMGTMTPSGLWLEIADQLVTRDQLTTHQAADVYATLSVAMHDSFIANWHTKYKYLVERPITWMRRENDPNWLSPIQTPPFPSYPSGHATVSGAASTVLAAYFPQDAGQLRASANDAAYSRIVGGIHWPLDSKVGLSQGQKIGTWVLSHPSAAATHAAVAIQP